MEVSVEEQTSSDLSSSWPIRLLRIALFQLEVRSARSAWAAVAAAVVETLET